AEGAVQRAADLARHTERAAVALGDIDALDLMRPLAGIVGGQPDEPFARAVCRYLLDHDLWAFEREMLGEFRAQMLRDIAHIREVAHATEIDPVPELGDAHL